MDTKPPEVLLLPSLHSCLTSWTCNIRKFTNLFKSKPELYFQLGVDYSGKKVNLFEYAETLHKEFINERNNQELFYSWMLMDFERKWNYIIDIKKTLDAIRKKTLIEYVNKKANLPFLPNEITNEISNYGGKTLKRKGINKRKTLKNKDILVNLAKKI